MNKKKEILTNGKILWNYHRMNPNPVRSDFIISLGSHDTRTALHAADLFNSGYAKYLVVTGGYGKVTRNLWGTTEAEKFKEISIEEGVPAENIIVENRSTNTGDNFKFTKEILDQKEESFKSGIIVTKPYMNRRAYATAAKQWDNISWTVSSSEISFEDYPNQEVSFKRMMNLMVGDLQRIDIYPSKGFQITQEIPEDVWESYNFLIENGYDEFVIKE